MKTGWLNQQGNTSCILFFTGWGMDPAPFQQIPVRDHDLLIIYDYTHIQPLDPVQLTGQSYKTLHLIAWSMGVWAAPFILQEVGEWFKTATAMNGTLTPIDDQCGIAEATYDTMIDHFSRTALEDFYTSMFTQDDAAEQFLSCRPKRSDQDLLDELRALKDHSIHYGPAPDCYRTKIVGSRDRVFSARNQVRCWGKDRCTLLKVPHFPFYSWPSWDTIITGELEK